VCFALGKTNAELLVLLKKLNEVEQICEDLLGHAQSNDEKVEVKLILHYKHKAEVSLLKKNFNHITSHINTFSSSITCQHQYQRYLMLSVSMASHCP
jgi:hypothetical protein